MRTRAFLVYGLVILIAACKGDVGLTGLMGMEGAEGAPGVADYEIVSQSFTVPAADPGFGTITITVNCPSGKLVLGGGIDTGDDLRAIIAQDSYPKADGTGWTLLVTNGYPTQLKLSTRILSGTSEVDGAGALTVLYFSLGRAHDTPPADSGSAGGSSTGEPRSGGCEAWSPR